MYEMGVVGTKHVPEELMLNDLSSMFEMGTGTNYSQATKY
jgi:hypothetical protein